MIQIETILNILWKGLLIGIVVSAPLGPVGVLCIQRTLNKGRWYGFVTGIGAALSDIIYALITGYGMSFVFDYVNKNLFYLQLFGSVLLLAFGIYTFRSNGLGQQGNLSPQLLDGILRHTVQSPHYFPVHRLVRTVCFRRARRTDVRSSYRLHSHPDRGFGMVVQHNLLCQQGKSTFQPAGHLDAEPRHRQHCRRSFPNRNGIHPYGRIPLLKHRAL